MARAGIQCLVRTVPFPEVLARLRSGHYEAALMGAGGSGDPDPLLFGLFHSKGESNLTGLADRRLDKLLTEARQEAHFARRKYLYGLAEDRIAAATPAIFLRHGLSMVLCKRQVRSVEPYPDNFLRIRNAARVTT